VTETQGPLAGQRVVRGRENECSAAQAATPTRGEGQGATGSEVGVDVRPHVGPQHTR
jgi:hypothetical protein